jgi:hypothetical protein
MSRRRVQQTRSSGPESEGEPAPRSASSAPASGVVRKEDFDAELAGLTPSWTAVNAYLSRGEHRVWVEAHAARSPAFAEVLAALRNDHEERLMVRRGPRRSLR